ncbi:hypothetical protein ACOMHN_028778 [Nucella lapillus]
MRKQSRAIQSSDMRKVSQNSAFSLLLRQSGTVTQSSSDTGSDSAHHTRHPHPSGTAHNGACPDSAS